MTLFGSTFAVISSTGLYVNLIFSALSNYGDPFFTDPLLNPFVTGMNADSIANNLSMILVSGVLKTLSCGTLLRRLSGTVFPSHNPPAGQAQPAFQFDSEAYEKPSKKINSYVKEKIASWKGIQVKK